MVARKRYVLGAPRKVPSAKRVTRYSPSGISSAFLQCLFGGGAGQKRSLGGSSISSASKTILRFSSSSNNRCRSCRSSAFGVARREMGFQAILVPSLFQKVFGSCTCICSLDSLFGSHWIRQPYWFGCDAKAPAWLSRILSSPFVAQTQTKGPPSTSCSTTLLRPVCVARAPKILRSFLASSAIFLCLPKVLFRRRAWLRSFALEPCDAPVWWPPVALALLPEPRPAPCAFRRFSPFGPPSPGAAPPPLVPEGIVWRVFCLQASRAPPPAHTRVSLHQSLVISLFSKQTPHSMWVGELLEGLAHLAAARRACCMLLGWLGRFLCRLAAARRGPLPPPSPRSPFGKLGIFVGRSPLSSTAWPSPILCRSPPLLL